METNRKLKKLKVIALIVMILAASIIYTFAGGHNTGIEDVSVDRSGEQTDVSADVQEQIEEEEPVWIYVDVGGAVGSPQVVCVQEGSRVFQAIEKAGGATQEADMRNINLAEPCQDGVKIYVPTASEIEHGTVPVVQSGSTVQSGNGKININTASSEDLQTLTGVGPGLAQRIIEYRESEGSFSSIEDLKNVSGIGEKTFEKMKNDICI